MGRMQGPLKVEDRASAFLVDWWRVSVQRPAGRGAAPAQLGAGIDHAAIKKPVEICVSIKTVVPAVQNRGINRSRRNHS